MQGRRVKLMLYNQPRRSLRKEVDIGTLQHVVQRMLVHSIDGCGNAVTSFNEGVEGSSRIMVLDSRMRELWIRVPGVGARCGNGLFSCLLYTSPSPRDATLSRMPSSA